MSWPAIYLLTAYNTFTITGRCNGFVGYLDLKVMGSYSVATFITFHEPNFLIGPEPVLRSLVGLIKENNATWLAALGPGWLENGQKWRQKIDLVALLHILTWMLEKKSRKVFSDIDLRTSAAAVDVEVEHFWNLSGNSPFTSSHCLSSISSFSSEVVFWSTSNLRTYFHVGLQNGPIDGTARVFSTSYATTGNRIRVSSVATLWGTLIKDSFPTELLWLLLLYDVECLIADLSMVG